MAKKELPTHALLNGKMWEVIAYHGNGQFTIVNPNTKKKHPPQKKVGRNDVKFLNSRGRSPVKYKTTKG